MPKLLPPDDPNLLKAVTRLARGQLLWGWLFIGLGGLTELAAGAAHPVAGLPFIAIGIACLRWSDPALIAAVATLLALSIWPALDTRASILGPEPLYRVMNLGFVERGALVFVKGILVYTALQQFIILRFLYGTEGATSDDPNLPLIPALIPNNTNRFAIWARFVAFGGITFSIMALLLTLFAPTSTFSRTLAELGGSLGAVALGLGLGVAFSPTDEREAALWAIGLGTVSYIASAVLILQLP
jgi:hypothetical protein